MSQIALCVLAAILTARTPNVAPPVAVFAELDGTWAGTFVGYDAAGRELYRIEVRQTYRTIDDERQEVVIEDRMPDGTVITGRGVNTARREVGGTVQLTCRVEKSNGDVVEHAGRLVRGPDGDEQIVWYSSAPDRVETFREVVHADDEGAVYEINGMGHYGDSRILMHGRYRRQSGDRPTHQD